VAEGQILLNPINVGWVKQLGVPQALPTFWVLALLQMPSAGASLRDFAGPFAH